MYNGDDDRGIFGFGGFGGLMPSGYAMHNRQQRGFKGHYRVYSLGLRADKQDANYGGKILLPQSALSTLSQLEVMYPMLFKLYNPSADKYTHSGVLEFTAEEGRVYVPEWMMSRLGVSAGSVIEVINVSLPLGTMVKLQPQSTDFLDITDHRAVLENELRKFSAFTPGDVFAINYNAKEYRVAVLETKPSDSGINIVETNLSVDFAPPVGYVEPSSVRPSGANSGVSSIDHSRPASSIARDIMRREEKMKEDVKSSMFLPFSGDGNRLNKKKALSRSYALDDGSKDTGCETAAGGAEKKRMPLNVPVGTLFFGYPLVPPPGANDDEQKGDDNKPKFEGEGRVLRQRRKRN